jgi:hypothetical protein
MGFLRNHNQNSRDRLVGAWRGCPPRASVRKKSAVFAQRGRYPELSKNPHTPYSGACKCVSWRQAASGRGLVQIFGIPPGENIDLPWNFPCPKKCRLIPG